MTGTVAGGVTGTVAGGGVVAGVTVAVAVTVTGGGSPGIGTRPGLVPETRGRAG